MPHGIPTQAVVNQSVNETCVNLALDMQKACADDPCRDGPCKDAIDTLEAECESARPLIGFMRSTCLSVPDDTKPVPEPVVEPMPSAEPEPVTKPVVEPVPEAEPERVPSATSAANESVPASAPEPVPSATSAANKSVPAPTPKLVPLTTSHTNQSAHPEPILDGVGAEHGLDADSQGVWDQVLSLHKGLEQNGHAVKLSALGPPDGVATQMVSGMNYIFKWNSGAEVTVWSQPWMQHLEVVGMKNLPSAALSD